MRERVCVLSRHLPAAVPLPAAEPLLLPVIVVEVNSKMLVRARAKRAATGGGRTVTTTGGGRY